MRKIVFILLSFFVTNLVAQRDSLPLGSKYKEDQLYVSVLYNQLYQQPKGVSSSGFSYGFNLGFFKDIPLNQKGNWALGLGLGYSIDSFNHGMQVTSDNGVDGFSIDNILDENLMRIQSIELPLEIRWRNSNAQKYKFWRVYPGIKFSYNTSNKFRSLSNGIVTSVSNISSFNRFQYGITLAAGYDAFNLKVYYSLTPLFNDAYLGGQSIETRILRVGLVVYIL